MRSFFLRAGWPACYAAIRIMRGTMAGQRARVHGTIVGNRCGSILRHHTHVKIHQPLPADIRIDAPYAVRGVTYRTTETSIDMTLMLVEAGVRHDVTEVVTLAAHGVRPVHAEIGISK